MKFQTYIKRFPALTMIVMLLSASIFLSSCDDEEVISEDVVLESFGPSGVNHGETIKFIGRNLDKVSAIVLPGAEVNSGQFTSQSSGMIELVVPQTAEAGKVILKTPKGDLQSKAMLSFLVPVEIESITAEARPGSDITIKGKMVNWIEEITFEDGNVVTEFVSKSLNELVVTVPMEAQTGFLLFKSGGTKPLSFVSEEELIVTLPAVSALSTTSIKHTENLTITGTNLDLVNEIMFAGDQSVTEFVSQSATEIVVEVPAQAVKGIVTLKQASPVDVMTAEELSIILPVGTSLTPKPAVPGTDNITIAGTNLDLVASLTLAGVADPIAADVFVSHSAEEIVLALPEGAKAGAVRYTTIHGYMNLLGVNIVLPGAGPEPLAMGLYDDEIFFGGTDGSWGALISDPASTEQSYSGTKSWKLITDGGGGAKAQGMTGVDASGMGVFVFSLYGGPGTDGKQVAAVLGSDGADNWGSYNAVTLVEGEWTEYRLELSKYATVNLKNVNIFIFKLEGAAPGDIIYVDRVGFDPAGPVPPAPLLETIFDDAAQNGFSAWGGFNGGTTEDNTEIVRIGTTSRKATFAGGWTGAAQFGNGNLSTEGATKFAFSMYGGEGTGGERVKLLIKSPEGELEAFIPVVEGEWTDVEISLSEIGGPSAITEFFFQDADFSGVVYFDHIGLR